MPAHVFTALSHEIDAAVQLMRQSLRLLRELRYVNLDADPLFACMATGTEKITKLTLGLAMIEDEGRWPDKATMKDVYGHRVVALDQQCRTYMVAHANRATSTSYIRGLLSGVEKDNRIHLVLTALDRYGTKGRFYNLDQLAEVPQPEPPPRDLWEDIERTVWENNKDILARIGGADFEESQRRINSDIAASVEGWWELYFRSWSHGVIGSRARQWSSQLWRD